MTPSGIEPATLRFVAQLLNHCATKIDAYRGYEIEGLPSVPSDKRQRDSEVQVDHLRCASEVGTGLSVAKT
jgi:hypothetical protein